MKDLSEEAWRREHPSMQAAIEKEERGGFLECRYNERDMWDTFRSGFEAGRASLGLPEARLRDARELKALRAVAEAAAEYIASRGKVQEKTPLHDALAAYYRTLAAASHAGQVEGGKGER